MKKPPRRESMLVSWIGHADIKAAEGDPGAGLGPIAQAVAFKDFTQVVLLSDVADDRTRRYLDWLRQRTDAPLDLHPCTLFSPMHFGEIYQDSSAFPVERNSIQFSRRSLAKTKTT